MSEDFKKYRDLQKKLTWIRWSHLGHESDEEDALLDEMDVVWWKLSDPERAKISSEPSRKDPLTSANLDVNIVDVDVETEPGRVRKKIAA